MKKSILFFLIGVFLIASSLYLYFGKDKIKYANVESNLSREEAVSVMTSLINDVINIYESPSNFFSTDNIDDSNLIKINNYDVKIKEVFTENGITQFENMHFNSKKYVTKNDDGIFFLNSIPKSNTLFSSNKLFENVSITSNTVSSKVTFSSDELDSDGNVLYRVIVKDITISKVNDSWYIDSFNYSNNN